MASADSASSAASTQKKLFYVFSAAIRIAQSCMEVEEPRPDPPNLSTALSCSALEHSTGGVAENGHIGGRKLRAVVVSFAQSLHHVMQELGIGVAELLGTPGVLLEIMGMRVASRVEPSQKMPCVPARVTKVFSGDIDGFIIRYLPSSVIII